jgi:hypothetical protein
MEGNDMPSNRRSTRSIRFPHVACAAVFLVATSSPGAVMAGSAVLFDFARLAECRDVTPAERLETYPDERLLEVRLPISVRFHGVPAGDVEKIDVDVDGSSAGLRVEEFAPTTELASDVKEIETTTTTKRARSLDATLGGALPIPTAELVAHVIPSISAGAARSEEATERTRRLPPKHVVVASGTAHQGRGVFYSFKRSSQTSLEGVHELTIVFVAPVHWAGGSVQIACGARGHRQVLWIDQRKSLGGATGTVELYRQGDVAMREAAMRRAGVAVSNQASAAAVPVAVYPTEEADEETTVQADTDAPAEDDLPQRG